MPTLYPTDAAVLTEPLLRAILTRTFPDFSLPRTRKDAWLAGGFILQLLGGDPDTNPDGGNGIQVATSGASVTAADIRALITQACGEETQAFYTRLAEAAAMAFDSDDPDAAAAMPAVSNAFLDSILAALVQIILDRLNDPEFVDRMLTLLLELILKRGG